ncbi:MAG: SpoIIE family protein phosphatase [Hahellaceae bacterium]|nr:SpoIIE family protein phosphatase [Hahellaceae bacterium]MCP5170182.1 SpoIIE family protein phosphatase [Hahellaceae bacterium]
MNLEFAFCTTAGNHYKENQDCILFNGGTYQRTRYQLQGEATLSAFKMFRIAIADGVSSSSHPAFASHTLLKGLHALDQQKLYLPPSELCYELRDYLIKAGRANQQYRNAASTLVTAEVSEARTRVWHAGDSRAYRYCSQSKKLTQLTQDHSFFSELVQDYPELSENADLYKDTIIRGVDNLFSTSPYYDCPTASSTLVDFRSGDILMLCSDGLTENLSNDDIEQLVVWHSCPKTVEKLVTKALSFPIADNISVICLKHC